MVVAAAGQALTEVVAAAVVAEEGSTAEGAGVVGEGSTAEGAQAAAGASVASAAATAAAGRPASTAAVSPAAAASSIPDRPVVRLNRPWMGALVDTEDEYEGPHAHRDWPRLATATPAVLVGAPEAIWLWAAPCRKAREAWALRQCMVCPQVGLEFTLWMRLIPNQIALAPFGVVPPTTRSIPSRFLWRVPRPPPQPLARFPPPLRLRGHSARAAFQFRGPGGGGRGCDEPRDETHTKARSAVGAATPPKGKQHGKDEPAEGGWETGAAAATESRH